MPVEMDFQFLNSLRYSLTKCGTPDLQLKGKQFEAVKAVVHQKKDVLAILPTGYGKSLIYQVLPNMFNFLRNDELQSIAIIVSPLTTLMVE